MSEFIKSKKILNGNVICLPVDSNEDENEIILRSVKEKQEYAFAMGKVVNSDSTLGIPKDCILMYRKSGAQRLRNEGTDYFVIQKEAIVGY